jgi:hypothetical protein
MPFGAGATNVGIYAVLFHIYTTIYGCKLLWAEPPPVALLVTVAVLLVPSPTATKELLL